MVLFFANFAVLLDKIAFFELIFGGEIVFLGEFRYNSKKSTVGLVRVSKIVIDLIDFCRYH